MWSWLILDSILNWSSHCFSLCVLHWSTQLITYTMNMNFVLSLPLSFLLPPSCFIFLIGELLFIVMFQSWGISAICFFKDSLFSLNVFLGYFNPISSYSVWWKITLNRKLYVSRWKMISMLLATSLVQASASLFNSHSAPLTTFCGSHCNVQHPFAPLTAP